MELLLIILLVLFLFGGWGYRAGWGVGAPYYGPGVGIVGVILLVLLVLYLSGHRVIL